MNIETREAGSRRNRRTGLIEKKKRSKETEGTHVHDEQRKEAGSRRNRRSGLIEEEKKRSKETEGTHVHDEQRIKSGKQETRKKIGKQKGVTEEQDEQRNK